MSSEKLFFMLSDDEKFLRDGINLVHFAVDTIKQLKQLGFNESNTQFNINSEGMTKEFYIMALKISRVINQNTLNNSFGTKSNIGEMFYPIIQMVPCFLFSKQCIVIAGEDQDPFFRLARDVARKLKLLPPIILYTINVPGLNGSQKMSTSIPESKPIFLTDTIERITEAVNKISIVGAGVQLLPSFYTIFTINKK